MPPPTRPRPKPKASKSTTTTISALTTPKLKPTKGSASHRITSVVLGSQLIPAWYTSSYPLKAISNDHDSYSPFPLAASTNPYPASCERIYVCEHCFSYTLEASELLLHKPFCLLSEEPLGKLVYAHNGFSIYEVDGEEHTLFCQCLSLFAKLFLDTKSISYDVEPFLFYTLVEDVPPPTTDGTGVKVGGGGGGKAQQQQQQGRKRIVGFFSKEKMSWDGNILACILIFPPYQRRGLGKILISFSYVLARGEGKIGGPEKPLSDLGQKGYRSYWTSVLAAAILNRKLKKPITITDLSRETWIHQEDVVATLRSMGAIGRGAPNAAGEPAGWIISRSRVREFVAAAGVKVGSGGIAMEGVMLDG
ncbi:acyl-CoA N-acyltransferase [Tuber indicum]|nr:acyl-CoA N-acyltransferase [Tuber indicum]